MKLREILHMPAFEGFRIVAGEKGLDRDISTVSVMDAPDIYKWMKGGEFLITSAYVVKDCPGYIKSLVENLNHWGASALGVKFDRFIHEFPRDALEAAEHLDFPIISIPYRFAFTDVINPVLQEVINSQARKMLYTENVHDAFTKMVLKDEEIPSILYFLEQHIHCEVGFVDTCFFHTHFSQCNTNESRLYQDIMSQTPDFSSLTKLCAEYEHYRLYINQEEYGYIFMGDITEEYDSSFDDYYKIAVEQAGTVLILKIQKQLATTQIEANYREQFVIDLLMSNFTSREEIMNRAKIYNWNLRNGGAAVIVDVDHFKQQYLERLDKERSQTLEKTMGRILNICKRIVHREYGQAVYSRQSDQIVFIISDVCSDPGFCKKLKSVFEEVKQEVRMAVSFTATIGIGSYKERIEEICASWEEAKKAVRISQNMLREDVLSVYDELGAYKLLSLVSATREAEEFQRVYIVKLKEYDNRYHTEFLKTVFTLAACGWNLKEASEKLYIHYNSMKYRYQKICKLLEMDLRERDHRLNLELALKLYQIREGI